jgi:hypothetical protein
MNDEKQIKHKKLKNTGIIFEVMKKWLVSDLAKGKDSVKSYNVIRDVFGPKTQLRKELNMYNAIRNFSSDSEAMALDLVKRVLESRSSLNHKKLEYEKYMAISKIKQYVNISDLFSSKIFDYKKLAEIWKMFNSNDNKKRSLTEQIEDHNNLNSLIKLMTQKSEDSKQEIDESIEEFKKSPLDIRILALDLMIESFNQTYSNKFNKYQKQILNEYVNTTNSNSSEFKKFFIDQIEKVNEGIDIITKKLKDSDLDVKVKLSETKSHISKLINRKNISDNEIMQLLKTHELLRETIRLIKLK